MDWSDMPDLILEEIFLFLKPPARYRAAMSCKNWYRVFLSPVLWRKFIIKPSMFHYRKHHPVHGWQTTISHYKISMCLSKTGHCWESLEIQPMKSYYALYEIIKILSSYLEFYDDYPMMDLKSFSFTFPCENNGVAGDDVSGTGGKILEEIKRLLGNLRDLEDLKVRNLLLEPADATGFLDDVAINCEKSLLNLEILNCTKRRYPLFYISRFPNLRKLSITPSHLTDDVILMIARHASIQEIVIIQDNFTKNPEPVSSNAWLEARFINPELKVRLELHKLTEHDLLIQDRAPVREIIYNSAYSRTSAEEIMQISEVYPKLEMYGHLGLPRRFSPRPFLDRADTLVVLLIRECLNIHTLIIHEKLSTTTLLIIAKEARNLKRFAVRRNAILKKFDWPINNEWTNEYYLALKPLSQSFELTEQEVGRLLKQPGWHMMSDREFKEIKL